MLEACDGLLEEGIALDAMRLRGFPFNESVREFIEQHDAVFVVEQNRDGQMRTLLVNELGIAPDRMIPVLNYDGMPITASWVKSCVRERFPGHNVTALHSQTVE